MAEKKYLDYEGLQELVLKIKEYVGDAGKIEFKGTVADVAHLPTLSEQKVGWMYTIQAAGTTTADFTDGAGLTIAANSEVACVEVDVSGTPTKKWCLLGPVFDVSDKLSFTITTMPANPSQDDVVMYLGETTYEYNEVTPAGTENPSALGWYESDGEGGYVASSDTEVDSGKTYYTKDEVYVQGVVYQYDTTDGWEALNSGDTMTPITNQEIDNLFQLIF